MRLAYEEWAPGADARQLVRIADEICSEYGQQGYDLTLRQLYYQFVARDIIPNRQQSYKRLGDIVNRARLAGLLDWSYIVDRTRNLRGTSHWTTPSQVIDSAAASYRIDKWDDQPVRVEVWVEKEALAGIVQRTAGRHDVNWFSCRGYVSQSELWGAAQRHYRYLASGQRVVVLHLGDHDPSGIDMTRDIRDRLEKFIYSDWYRDHRDNLPEGFEPTYHNIRDQIIDDHDLLANPIVVHRIALNRDQIDTYDPPPNPAKLTDSRASSYIREHGYESWELDALDPTVLDQLIGQHIERLRDDDRWHARLARETAERASLRSIANSYESIAEQFGDAS